MPPTNSLPQIIFKRPLVGLDCARAALGIDTDAVRALIDCGQLIAFNIAGEIYFQQHVRILAESLSAHQQSRKLMLEFGEVTQIIFPMMPVPRPGVIASIDVAGVARQLNVKSDLIHNVVQAGFLKLIPGDKARRGPAGSPRLEFSSVTSWLKKRLIQ